MEMISKTDPIKSVLRYLRHLVKYLQLLPENHELLGLFLGVYQAASYTYVT